MHEFVSDPRFGKAYQRGLKGMGSEKQAQGAMGLCFESPPACFSHRYVSPVNPETLRTPSWSWVYHIANNYVIDKYRPFAKTRVDQIFGPDAALSWRPTLQYMQYLHRARRKIARALAPAK